MVAQKLHHGGTSLCSAPVATTRNISNACVVGSVAEPEETRTIHTRKNPPAHMYQLKNIEVEMEEESKSCAAGLATRWAVPRTGL